LPIGAPPPGTWLFVSLWLAGGGGCDHTCGMDVHRKIIKIDIFMIIFFIVSLFWNIT